MKFVMSGLVLVATLGCLPACEGSASPGPRGKSCDPVLEVVNEGRILKIDGSGCQADVLEFIRSLRENDQFKSLDPTKLESISVIGPAGADNLERVESAWLYACGVAKGYGAKASPRNFEAEYLKSPLMVGLKRLIKEKYRMDLSSVSVDNFYPLKNDSNAERSCDSSLYLPVIWLER